MIDIQLTRSRLHVLSVVQDINEIATDYFIIGATARDLLFEESKQIPVPVATQDVDIAVFVDSWDMYEGILSALLCTEKYSSSRLVYRLTSQDGTIVDILPYGGVESETHAFHFPGDESKIFSVLGYREVYNHSLNLRLNGDAIVNVATPPGITLLKLISWNDGPYERVKDVQDILFIMRNYSEYLGLDAYASFPELFADNYQDQIASAEMLGIHVGQILAHSDMPRNKVLEIVSAQSHDQYDSRFIDLNERKSYVTDNDAFAALQAFHAGINESSQTKRVD